MKIRKIILFFNIFLICLIFIGCSSKSSERVYTADYKTDAINTFSTNNFITESDNSFGLSFDESSDIVMKESFEKDMEKVESGASVKPDKVITIVNMTMETTDFDKSIKNLNSLINENDAYIEESQINNGTYSTYLNESYRDVSYKYANYVIRIPKYNYNDFIGDINNIGFIKNENKTTEDVTKNYEDTQSRLKVLKLKEERILKLLEKAETMKDIIYLEDTLNEVIYQKENLSSKLKVLDNKVDFSTLKLQINEVHKIVEPETIKTDFTTKFKYALKDSFDGFLKGLQELIISLAYILPLLISSLIVMILLIVTIKIRKNKKKNSKKSMVNNDK